MYDYWNEDNYIEHHGIKGQKWGVRRYQNEDGSLTEEGRRRYLKGDGSLTLAGKRELRRRQKIASYGIGSQLNRAYKGENVTMDKTTIPKDFNDNTWKKYETTYKHDSAKYFTTSLLLGIIPSAIINENHIYSEGFGKEYAKYVKNGETPKEAIDTFCQKYKINTSIKVDDIKTKNATNGVKQTKKT